jgi:hypothetical protein
MCEFVLPVNKLTFICDNNNYQQTHAEETADYDDY